MGVVVFAYRHRFYLAPLANASCGLLVSPPVIVVDDVVSDSSLGLLLKIAMAEPLPPSRQLSREAFAKRRDPVLAAANARSYAEFIAEAKLVRVEVVEILMRIHLYSRGDDGSAIETGELVEMPQSDESALGSCIRRLLAADPRVR